MDEKSRTKLEIICKPVKLRVNKNKIVIGMYLVEKCKFLVQGIFALTFLPFQVSQ
jgi:hypothetical protein